LGLRLPFQIIGAPLYTNPQQLFGLFYLSFCSPEWINPFTLRSKSRRPSSTLRLHPRHLIPISAPNLTTCHSQLPQGCFFFKRTTSPRFMSMRSPERCQLLVDLVAQLQCLASRCLRKILSLRGIKYLPGTVNDGFLLTGINPVSYD